MHENQIVVYQAHDVMRIDVRIDDETVWLAQPQIAELFSCSAENVRLHLKNIYASGELLPEATSKESLEVRQEGRRRVSRKVVYYNLDAIISIGYRVNSIVGVRFRQWATRIIRDRMLAGAAQDARFAVFDKKLSVHDREIDRLKERVDFFVQTREPPMQGVFYDGQIWDAYSFVSRLVARAKKSILLIDNWIGMGTLDVLAKKRNNVHVQVVTSCRGNKLSEADVAKFNVQYPTLRVCLSEVFHDRFLILDDQEIYLVGASLKDLGKKCFGFTKMNVSEILGIKARLRLVDVP